MKSAHIGEKHLTRFAHAESEMARRLRDQDWAASPIGAADCWPDSLCTLVGVMLASSQPMFIVWGQRRTTLYNDAYASILADKHPALGLPFEEVWEEIWDEDLKPIVTRAYSGEALHMDDIPLTMLRKGFPEETHFSFSYTPVFNTDGEVEGFFCPCLEITDQVLEERRIRLRSELTERLRVLEEPQAISRTAAELLGRYLDADEVFYAQLAGKDDRVRVRPEWHARSERAGPAAYRLRDLGKSLVDDLLSGASFSTPDALADERLMEDGARNPLILARGRAMVAVPVWQRGSVVAALVILCREPRFWHPGDIRFVEEVAARMTDASESARLETARLADEKRLHETQESLALATAASELGAGTWDFTTGKITLDERGRKIVGLASDMDRISDWLARTHPDDRAKLDQEIRSCLAGARPFDLQYRVVHGDGLVKHIHGTGLFHADAHGAPLLGTGFVRDVTDLIEAELHQNLLMAELDHRVKNVLALVQSIAQMTLRKEKGGTSLAGASFMGRIKALAQSHSLLAKSRWKGTDLRDLVRAVVEPFQGRTARLNFLGASVTVAPKAAQTLALALHELLTNAAKYGALSNKQGTVDIGWKVVGEEGERQLVFTWQERGGPPIEQVPTERGFGSLLIEGSLSYELQGNVTTDFARTGLVVEFILPMKNIAAHSGALIASMPASTKSEEELNRVLIGTSILVIEDDLLVACQAEEAIRSAGAKVIGPFGQLDEALRHAVSDTFDAAILDVNLHGEFVWPVARALRARGIPFVFATGYSELLQFPDDLAESHRVEKPYEMELVLARLDEQKTIVG